MSDTAAISIKKLEELWFFVTSRCNLTCKHCYVEASPTNKCMDNIKAEDVEKVLNGIEDIDLKNIYLTGGEPFVLKDIMKIIEICTNRCHVTILTNSLLISKENIKELSKYNVTIRISLESMDEEENDVIRGKGVYKKVIDNIKDLDKNGVKTLLSLSASEKNATAAKEFIKKHSLNTEVKEIPLFNSGRYTSEFSKEKEKEEIDAIKITSDCLKKFNKKEEDFMCCNTRNVSKKDGKLIVTPCPIVFKDLVLGNDVKGSLKKVELADPACYDYCFKQGGSCSN